MAVALTAIIDIDDEDIAVSLDVLEASDEAMGMNLKARIRQRRSMKEEIGRGGGGGGGGEKRRSESEKLLNIFSVSRIYIWEIGKRSRQPREFDLNSLSLSTAP